MVKRAKRFDDGGVVGNTNYPFGQGQSASSAPAAPSPIFNSGLGNSSPLVQVNTPGAATENAVAAKPFGMKRGGKVTVSKRADGIAQRGKTRGRMI
jgi:hypothetical protein